MKRFNLIDAALILLLTGIVGAMAIHIFVRNPLRKSVLDEAPRTPVEIEVVSESAFLADRMTAGDAQPPGVELLSFRVEGGRLLARFRVQARTWRGFRQYGEFTLVPGERFEFVTAKYKLIGTIRDVPP